MIPAFGCWKLVGHQPVQALSLIDWAQWFQTADRRVAFTDGKDCSVSTVFLGLDHSFGSGPPLLFETMIFPETAHSYQKRCSTWDEALAMHAEACEIAFPAAQLRIV